MPVKLMAAPSATQAVTRVEDSFFGPSAVGVCLGGVGVCVGSLMMPVCKNWAELVVPSTRWIGGGEGLLEGKVELA